MAQRIHPDCNKPLSPELLSALEKTKDHVLTKEEFEAQKRSWAIGNIALDRPDRSVEEITASVDKSIARGY